MKKQAQRLFQFSSVDDKEYVAKIKIAIKLLGGSFDESRLYAPKATHLIVDKMECTEKILCFIAAGKWIVTPSYIKNSYREKRFLDEHEFHVSVKFPRSKLALVSLKWREKIADSRANYPCHDWRVACFLSNQDKAKAIARIIEAGAGSCHLMKQAASVRSSRLSLSSYTLVICDELTRAEASDFAHKYGLLCYPYQAIPDYLMQCIKSGLPILPLKHYGSLSSSYLPSTAGESSQQAEPTTPSPMTLDKSVNDNFYEHSYRKFFLATNRSKIKITLVEASRESAFRIFWQNDGGIYEALRILQSMPSGELPSSSTLVLLFEYLLDQPVNRVAKLQRSLSLSGREARRMYEQIYGLVYSYLLGVLLANPPTSSSAITYYHEVFENLAMSYRMNLVSEDDVFGVVDVLYLMSIHDYIIFNTTHLTNIYHNISLRWTEADNEALHKKLLGKLVARSDSSILYLKKLLEIVSFCNFYLNPTTMMYQASAHLDRILSSGSKHPNGDSLRSLLAQVACSLN